MRLRLSSKNFYEYCGIYIQGKKICEIPAKPAFIDVLENLSEDEFNVATKNLILMVLHEGALGQVMHFPKTAKKFRIMQLTIPKSIPIKIMRYVIAHEFGHVIQDRNWKKSYGAKLENDADSWVKKCGFPLEASFREWMDKDRLIEGRHWTKE